MSQVFYEPTQRLDNYVYAEQDGITNIKSTVVVWLRMGEYVDIDRKIYMDGGAYKIKLEVKGDAINNFGYYWVGEKMIPVDSQKLYEDNNNLTEAQKKDIVKNRIEEICPGNFYVVIAEIFTKDGSGGSVTNVIRKDADVEID
jgi:hypothetical protein